MHACSLIAAFDVMLHLCCLLRNTCALVHEMNSGHASEAVWLQVSLVLRSIQRGYIPDKSFVIVSFIATGVLLIGWRSALAAATKVSAHILLLKDHMQCVYVMLSVGIVGHLVSCF